MSKKAEDRHFPFHIPISKSKKLTGFIMVEQIKSIDYQSRSSKFIEKVHQNTLNEVLSILDAIVY
jgi:mRNA interferase MazF